MFFCVDQKSGEITCVHSGGRRLNCNETKKLKNFTETNWLALETKKFTPFFHVFNDSIQENLKIKILVTVYFSGKKNKDKFCTSIDHNGLPNASEIYYLNKIFPNEILKQINNKDIWIEVNFSSYAFPRMITGNYDKEKDFHYITHSFGKIFSNDYVEPKSKGSISSILSLLNISPLNLKARSYPTNCQVN